MKREVDFIFKSLEFLDNSTFNLIPYEIVECPKCAMDNWLGLKENYIIATSLINNVEGFSFDPAIAFNDELHHSIEKKYAGLKFAHRLVQINIPKALSRDYLTAVVLYHELGHFIDTKYNISSALAYDLLEKYSSKTFSPSENAIITSYFPYLESILKKQVSPLILTYHFAEYFCDIFAAQYIYNCSSIYLDYLTESESNFGFNHPSTANRNRLVEDFLANTANLLVEFIKNGVRQATNKELEIRSTILLNDAFFHFLPVELNDEKELHGLFILGWQTWLGDWDKFTSNLNMRNPIKRSQVYSAVNNLIEKSISNYFINQKWKNVQLANMVPSPEGK